MTPHPFWVRGRTLSAGNEAIRTSVVIVIVMQGGGMDSKPPVWLLDTQQNMRQRQIVDMMDGVVMLATYHPSLFTLPLQQLTASHLLKDPFKAQASYVIAGRCAASTEMPSSHMNCGVRVIGRFNRVNRRLRMQAGTISTQQSLQE